MWHRGGRRPRAGRARPPPVAPRSPRPAAAAIVQRVVIRRTIRGDHRHRPRGPGTIRSVPCDRSQERSGTRSDRPDRAGAGSSADAEISADSPGAGQQTTRPDAESSSRISSTRRAPDIRCARRTRASSISPGSRAASTIAANSCRIGSPSPGRTTASTIARAHRVARPRQVSLRERGAVRARGPGPARRGVGSRGRGAGWSNETVESVGVRSGMVVRRDGAGGAVRGREPSRTPSRPGHSSVGREWRIE